MSATLQYIPLNKIRQNAVALRDVDKTGEDYLSLVDSVRVKGVLNPISVRPIVDPDTKEELFSIIDGLHRFMASQDSGREAIPAQVMTMEDAEVLKVQLITNAIKIETKPVEYSRQLQRILSNDATLTIAALAEQLNRSTSWLSERLNLTKLDKRVAELVDAGSINLSNAFVLAKLPVEEQPNFIDRAMTESPQQFAPTILQRKKDIEKARREGKDAKPAEYVVVPHLQKMGTLKAELDSAKIGPELVKVAKLDKLDSKTAAAEAGFKLGLQWALNLDVVSVELAKADYERHQKTIKDKKDAAAAERAKKKVDKANIQAARAQLEAELRQKGEDPTEALKAFDEKNGLSK